VGTRREADKVLSMLVSEAASSDFVVTRATVGELLDKWIEYIEQLGRRPSTIHGYRNKINCAIRPGTRQAEQAASRRPRPSN
jgi:hypothetical protein